MFFFRWLYIISHFYISRHISRHVLHLLNTAGAGRFADDAHWHGVADRADGSGPRRCAALDEVTIAWNVNSLEW